MPEERAVKHITSMHPPLSVGPGLGKSTSWSVLKLCVAKTVSPEIDWILPRKLSGSYQHRLQSSLTLSKTLILTFEKEDLKLCETKYTDIICANAQENSNQSLYPLTQDVC